MKKTLRSHEALTAGIAAGVSTFFLITGAGDSSFLLRIVVAVGVCLIVVLSTRQRYRAVSMDGDSLVVTDGPTVRRFSRGDIESYQIIKTTAYQLRVVLKNEDALVVPLHGFFSERSIRSIFDSLGVSRLSM
jgi:hypothetical protein